MQTHNLSHLQTVTHATHDHMTMTMQTPPRKEILDVFETLGLKDHKDRERLNKLANPLGYACYLEREKAHMVYRITNDNKTQPESQNA